MKKIFWFILLTANIAFAKPQYSIIIAADDDTTHSHIFQIDKTQNIPSIKEIYSESINSSLSSYANNPDQSGESLKQLLDDANTTLLKQHVEAKEVKISVLGTENMRMLANAKKELIYKNVRQFIEKNSEFPIGFIQDITPKNQSLAFWLSANYFSNTFQDNSETQGLLNIENNSTYIAFATNNTAKQNDETMLTINGKKTVIFSKQLSNIGQEKILSEVNKLDTAYYCYPLNYLRDNSIGNFDLNKCKDLYSSALKQHQIPSQILPHPNQSFIVIGNAQHVYEDFLSATDPDIYSYESRLYYACSSPWDSMKTEYDNFQETELAKICSHSVFIDRLIYDELQISGKDLFVTNKINNEKIDWPLGMILYWEFYR